MGKIKNTIKKALPSRSEKQKRRLRKKGAEKVIQQLEKSRDRLNKWINKPSKRDQAINELKNDINKMEKRLQGAEKSSKIDIDPEAVKEVKEKFTKYNSDLEELKKKDSLNKEDKKIFRDINNYIFECGKSQVEDSFKAKIEENDK